MDDLIRDLSRGNATRPADHGGYAHSALHDRVVEAGPGSSSPPPRPANFGAVVRHPDDDGVVRDSQALDGVEHQPGVVVDFCQRIADISGAGRAREVMMCERRKVDLRDGIVEKERLARAHAALHEIDAFRGRLAVERAAALEVENLYLLRRLTRFAFPDVRRWRLGRIVAGHRRDLRLVAALWDAVPLVEPLVGGFAFAAPIGFAAEMPLAVVARRIAC